MASPIPYPLVNGFRHAFNSIEMRFGPHTFLGFKAVNYGMKVSGKDVHGADEDAIGQTRGNNSYDADVEFYLAEWNNLIQITGPGWGSSRFLVIVNHTETGVETVTDVLIGCRLADIDANHAGDDPTVRKVKLMPVQILWSGTPRRIIPLAGIGI